MRDARGRKRDCDPFPTHHALRITHHHPHRKEVTSMADNPTSERQQTAHGARGRRAPRQRWECRCGDPPILLARYDPGGKIEIKLRDRYYIASGCVYATCPRCGAQHILDL